MNEQLSKAFEPLKQFWGNTSKSVKRIIVLGAIIAVVGALIFSLVLNHKNYVVIYDQLSQRETTEILSKLKDMNVDVRMEGGTSVLVPEEDESRVRMELATAGYPKSGLSYYLIEENSGMLTTDYERKQYMNMQLQERIAASIKTLDGVKDAVVTITLPNESAFYLQEKEKPSASVIIHMNDGNSLSDKQISGILNLVSKAVAGLSIDDIALADSQGNDLAGSWTGRSEEHSKINITREIENDLKQKVITVLMGPYRSDQYRLSVTAEVDTNAMVTETTTYEPSPDGKNSGVIREETRSQDSSSNSQTAGGVPGTSSNSEVPTYPAGGGEGSSSSSGSTESTKYEISTTKSQSQKSGAKIEKVSIGIAIDKAVFEPGEKESVTQLVAYATGVSPESISVQNFKFYSEKEPETGGIVPSGILKNKMMLYGVIGGGILLLAILLLIILLVAAGKKKKRRLQEAAELEAAKEREAALDDLFGQPVQEKVPPIVPIIDAKGEEIKGFARENPEIVAQMIRSWLRSEGE